VVINPEHLKYYNKIGTGFIKGGATRQESTFLGLQAISKYKPEKVLIHDAARPFVNIELLNRIITALKTHKAVLPVVKVADTIKIIKDGFVEKTIDREITGFAQTPQGFWFDVIFEAHQKTIGKNFTDDSAIAEFCNIPVFTVEGDMNNNKITWKKDLR